MNPIQETTINSSLYPIKVSEPALKLLQEYEWENVFFESSTNCNQNLSLVEGTGNLLQEKTKLLFEKVKSASPEISSSDFELTLCKLFLEKNSTEALKILKQTGISSKNMLTALNSIEDFSVFSLAAEKIAIEFPVEFYFSIEEIDLREDGLKVKLYKTLLDSKLPRWMLIPNFEFFKIEDPQARLELIELSAERDLSEAIGFFKDFKIEDLQDRIRLAKAWAEKNLLT